MSLLQCNNCGLIIESGLDSVTRHVFDECEAITVENINNQYSVRTMPYMNFSVIEDFTETKKPDK
jgi:hypothetical protein